jgi:hypothetical protein
MLPVCQLACPPAFLPEQASLHPCLNTASTLPQHCLNTASAPPPRRPVILPDYVELELRISPDARCTALVCFDGRDTKELQQVG